MIPNDENRYFNAPTGQPVLPTGWERAYDEQSNRYFYVDHNTRTTTWINPMEKARNISECFGEQLPYGWERLRDPIIGIYYANHIERRNQLTNPVSDWQMKLSQHHYSNSHHILHLEQSGNSLDSNNQTNSQTTGDTKPDNSLHASDTDDRYNTTSLNNSNTFSTDIIDTMRSNNSTRGSRYDADLLDIMDTCFGRESSQSVEV